MTKQISLSTMWARNRFPDLRLFWHKVQEWGFTHIEASSWLTPELADQLLHASLPVSSVHCPCPNISPRTTTGIASLSSIHEVERLEAVAAAKRTIDLAVKLGAKAVVLHLGEVALSDDSQERLGQLYHNGICGDGRKALVHQLLSERKRKALPFVNAATESLLELSYYAKEKGVAIGLETRFYLHEIPDIIEMEQLLCLINSDSVGYWHDVGHAEVQQRLGIASHREWLTRFSDRTIGVHLHDVRGLQDHLTPGQGEVHWQLLVQHLPSNIIKVCEIGEWNEENEVAGAVPFLLSQGML